MEENGHLGLVELDGERKDTLSFAKPAVQIYQKKKRFFLYLFLFFF
jgi:hypothetical protein